jgi:hypothetical protein
MVDIVPDSKLWATGCCNFAAFRSRWAVKKPKPGTRSKNHRSIMSDWMPEDEEEEEENEDEEQDTTYKDALLFLVDVNSSMFTPTGESHESMCAVTRGKARVGFHNALISSLAS